MKRYSDSVADNTLLVSQNVTNLMNDIRAEDLLNDAVYYIDARDASASGQTIDNLGTAKELLPTTLGSSTSADSNDPQYLSWSGTNYVYLPGTSGNILQVPDSAALDITGDIDIRIYLALDDWTPASNLTVLAKESSSSTRSYRLSVGVGGFPYFIWSTNGSATTTSTSTAAVSASDGTPLWLRATLDVDNGASGNTTTFYTSTDGTTWTQLGDAIIVAGTTSIFNSTSPLEIGSRFGGALENFPGKFYRAQILNGIGGTKVLDVDTSVLKTGAETSFTALTGQTVTINRSTSGRKTVAVTQPCWLFGTDDYMEVNNRYMSYTAPHLYLPGVNGNYASTPDAAVLDITGDIDIRVKVALDDWTPAASESILLSKTNSDSYVFNLLNTGVFRFQWVNSSNTLLFSDSTVANGIADGVVKWVRVTLDVDNGASGNTTTFYTSDDGTTWTQLGNTIVKAGTTNIRNTSGPLNVGGYGGAGTLPCRGDFFRAMVFNGIDGTKVFDADFENKITSIGQTSFVEASSNAATVTINRSGSAYRSAGITAAGYLYPGATNTFTASATNFLDFESTQDFSILFVARRQTTPANNGMYITKISNLGGIGYRIGANGTSTDSVLLVMYDGTTQYVSYPSAQSTNLAVFGTIISGNSLNNINNGVFGPTTTLSPARSGTIGNPGITLRIGAIGNTATSFQDFEFISAAVFRRALTSAEITLITNYFNRRSL